MTHDLATLLPHRDPFLLLDRVVELEPGVRAVAERAVTAQQDWARGHFPGDPVFPGVLLLEAMAQTGVIVVRARADADADRHYLLARADDVRFRAPVRPPAVVRLDATVDHISARLATGHANASVGDSLVASCRFVLALAP